MNTKQYNNVINWTLKHDQAAQTEDSLATARAVFNNMGVALPNGSMQEVYDTIKTNQYMGWRACTMEEAQEAANKGTAAIGISKDRVVILSASDEEEPVAETASVMTLSESTSAYAVAGLEYYAHNYGNLGNTYILVNGWLRLYTKPTISCTGRTVAIPTVSSFTGTDGHTYQFTNKNYWFAYENPYTTSGYINPYVRQKLELLGKTVVVNIGASGEYTNENGRYWMAVGPKVVNPNFGDNERVTGDNMAGKGVLDVVVKDNCGRKYYIPAVVGDGKAHTWNNGVIQTFKKYPNGTFDSVGGNFNGTVAAEFIGNLGNKMADLYEYSIDSIIFYPNKD